jgi:pimeloyl-ACP methyl ester carboxylesterase
LKKESAYKIMLKMVLGILSIVVLLYGLQLLLFALGQSYFIFQRFPRDQQYTVAFEQDYTEVYLSSGQERIHGLYFEPTHQTPKGVVLYLHGNRGHLGRWGKNHQAFTELGYAVLLIDYRGYGKSSGQPSEQGLYEDGKAALDWLQQRYSNEDIILYGRSLGSGVAAYLSTLQAVKLLILETPYDQMPHVIQRQVPFPMPKAIFRHTFPNDQWLAQTRCPAYVLAGSRDKLIPLKLSLRLKPLLPSPAHFITIEGAGHRNLSAFAEYHFHLRRLLLP